jgi:hypothetical protein
VAREIALPIAVKVETARHHPARNGSLPDTRVRDLALPLDVAWEPYIHRDKRIHVFFSSRREYSDFVSRELWFLYRPVASRLFLRG